jgi:hypothetical protein
MLEVLLAAAEYGGRWEVRYYRRGHGNRRRYALALGDLVLDVHTNTWEALKIQDLVVVGEDGRYGLALRGRRVLGLPRLRCGLCTAPMDRGEEREHPSCARLWPR